MTEYRIREISSAAELASAESFEIRHYQWGYAYAPAARAVLAFITDEGFYYRIQCFESDPVRTYTRDDDPVYLDSALELFLDCYPDRPGCGYLNLEVNANGAMISEFGPDKDERRLLAELGLVAPKPTITMTPDAWTVEFLVPLALIHQLYGAAEFHRGSVIRANFCTVGENTLAPHFGTFMPIDAEEPEFHLPSYFGRFVIE